MPRGHLNIAAAALSPSVINDEQDENKKQLEVSTFAITFNQFYEFHV